MSATVQNSLRIERGQTPDNIEQKCLNLCKEHLGGVWLNLTTDDIEVRRMSGGLTNQLYYCVVNEDKRISDEKVDQMVAIRIYGEKHFNNYDIESKNRLTDTVISLMVSENGLGPKVCGIFEGGTIQRYYHHKNFLDEERKVPKYVDLLARKLAGVHAMEVPLKKTGNWIFKYFDDSYRLAFERFDIKSLIEETKSETLKTHDLSEELVWLKRTVLNVDSPHVFTHVDFMGPNIMITESEDIILCDFEYSCYGYRGCDFGSLYVEWGRKWAPWGLWTEPHDYPTDETIKPFIKSYIEESVNLKGKQFSEDNRNTFDNILNEIKIFSLVYAMVIVLYFLKSNESVISGMLFNKVEEINRTERYYRTYWKFKDIFTQQNVF